MIIEIKKEYKTWRTTIDAVNKTIGLTSCWNNKINIYTKNSSARDMGEFADILMRIVDKITIVACVETNEDFVDIDSKRVCVSGTNDFICAYNKVSFDNNILTKLIGHETIESNESTDNQEEK